MATHERCYGEYAYTITVEPITPPLLNGDSYEAKVGEMVQRRQNPTAGGQKVYIGAHGKTANEAIKKAEERVEAWLASRRGKEN
jgi:hypothetical protein